MYEINDIRNDFKGISFSNFKKGDVQKQFIKSVLDSNIEPACFWSCELICAGHFKDLWDSIILLFIKHIHIANPKIAVYIDRRLTTFVDILYNGYDSRELHMRNNEKIRKMFAEVISIITFSKKSHPFEEIKINRIEFTELKLKATDLTFATSFRKDPKQLFLPLNELSYSLKTKNIIDSCYWVSWFIEYDCYCRNKKLPLLIERRTFLKNLNQNVVWMIWEIILEFSKNSETIVQTIIQSLLNIFTRKYSQTENKRKIFIFYFAISLLLGSNEYNINIIDDVKTVETVVSNIDAIYKQIKTKEIPAIDFVENINLDKTIERLEKMDFLTKNFLPRI
uniref:Uncharacterized protein n=1 Tax=viral metagenome TaxID=1070528 RepID=A0A6C0HR92_9ZZZZ